MQIRLRTVSTRHMEKTSLNSMENNLLDIETACFCLPDLKLYCVGTRTGINDVKNYFMIREGQAINIDDFIHRIIQNNVYACLMANGIRNRLRNCIANELVLRKNNLLISFDLYLEALCFSEDGRTEITRIFHATEEQIKDIMNTSVWNDVFGKKKY